MVAVLKDFHLPPVTTFLPMSFSQERKQQDWKATALQAQTVFLWASGRTTAGQLHILITGTLGALTTDSTPLWPGRLPEADEEDVVVPRVPPDNQDEGLIDSLAAGEILHVLRDSPNQHQGVGMETTRCQPSNETGVQMEIQHWVTGDRVIASAPKVRQTTRI